MAKAPPNIRSLARSHTEGAFNVMKGLMYNEETAMDLRFKCAVAILDRGWGKPAQVIAGDSDDGPIRTENINRDPEHLLEMCRKIAFILNASADNGDK